MAESISSRLIKAPMFTHEYPQLVLTPPQSAELEFLLESCLEEWSKLQPDPPRSNAADFRLTMEYSLKDLSLMEQNNEQA